MDERVKNLEVEVGEIEVRVSTLEKEVTRVRDRVHDMGTEMTLIRELSAAAARLAEGIDTIAERAVQKVLAEKRAEFRESWRYWLGWMVAVVAAVAFLAQHFHVHLGT